MESNRDEALKCLSIAQRHCNSGNYPSARRFAEKSISLFPTPEASKLLQRINELNSASASSDDPSGASTSAETHPSASGAKHRHHMSANPSSSSSNLTSNGTASGNSEKREFTPEQAAVVKRILSCKISEYYEIMSLQKDCTEAEVKKAYRKLALQLHPDKNGAPGADEAFKMVSKAFQILSDADKRAQYDRFGSDPESRFSGMSSASNGSAGFSGGPFGAGRFDGELSPEELFNMFFGGGGGFGGGPFGNGPVFTATFGRGGFRTTGVHMGGRRAGAQRQQREDTSLRTMLTQLAPLIILFLFTFLSAVPNLFSSPRVPDPRYSFQPSARFNMGRETSSRNVKYFVNQAEFMAHPIGKETVETRNDGRSGLLNKFERNVETSYIDQVYMICQRDQERQQRRKEAKMGFFGIGADWEGIKTINSEKIESCEEYNRIVGRR